MDHGRLLELADQNGFAVVYPEGVGKSWNDFRKDPISEAHRTDRDDVGFISALIDTMAVRHGIDRSRVYIAGISNGGFFSIRLACEASDRIAGAVIVTATLPEAGMKLCNPGKPVHLVFINGTEDPLVPYEGGEVKVFGSKRGRVLSTDASLAFFASRFGCNAPLSTALPVRVADDATRVIRHHWQCPSTKLQLYEIQGGGHTWPGGVQYLAPGLVGRVSKQLVASDVIGSLMNARS
jgi:polyhydroxybutyrate depolymerase